MEEPTFSLILPFWKQEDYMHGIIDDYVAAFTKAGESFEIIVVMNGVSDLPEESTYREIAGQIRMVECKIRQIGWGRAIKYGLGFARGKYICYTNTARTYVSELIRVLQYAKVSDQVVVKGARLKRENKFRKAVSFIYNFECRLFLKTPVLDVNATPKIIPKHIIDQMTFVSEYDLFDAELLYQCYLNFIDIIEVPVRWGGGRKGWKSTTNIKTAIRLAWSLPFLKLKKQKVLPKL